MEPEHPAVAITLIDRAQDEALTQTTKLTAGIDQSESFHRDSLLRFIYMPFSFNTRNFPEPKYLTTLAT